jgi:hypothetical protein
MTLTKREVNCIEAAIALASFYLDDPKINDIYVFMAQLWESWESSDLLEDSDIDYFSDFYQNRNSKFAKMTRFRRKLITYFNHSDQENYLYALNNNKALTYQSEIKLKNPQPDLLKSCIERNSRRKNSYNLNFLDLDSIKSENTIELWYKRPYDEINHFQIPCEKIPDNHPKIGLDIETYNDPSPSFQPSNILKIAKNLDDSIPWINTDNSRSKVLKRLFENITWDKNIRLTEGIKIPKGLINKINTPTGSGKSVFMRILALNQALNFPVVIVVDRVEEILKNILLLRKANNFLNYGLNISPYIAPKGRYGHLARIIESEKDNNKSGLFSLALKELSYICRLQKYSIGEEGDFPSGKEPCFSLILSQDDDKRYICPFLKKCSRFAMYKKCAKADIIVTSKMALLKSRFPLNRNSENESLESIYFLQFCLERAGLILIDEVETLQGNIADSFSEEYNLTRLFEIKKETEEVIKKFGRRKVRYGEIKAALNNLDNVYALTEEWLYHDKMKWPGYDYIKDISQTITLEALIGKCLSIWIRLFDFKKETISKKLFFKLLNNNQSIKRTDLTPLANNQEEINNLYTLIKSLIRIIKKLNSLELTKDEKLDKSQSDLRNLIEDIRKINAEVTTSFKKKIAYFVEHFILLIRLRKMKKCLNDAISKLNRISEISSGFNHPLSKLVTRNQLLSFSPYGCLGKRIYSFEYKRGDTHNSGDLKIKTMMGTPQRILEDLGNNFSQLLCEKKVSILGFSATSVFPFAFKNHTFGKIIGWMRDTGDHQNIMIDQLLFEENDNTIRISGSQPDNRKKNLKLLLDNCLSMIKSELDRLREKNPIRSKILLVTNTYKDAYVVAKKLLKTNLKSSFKVILRAEYIENEDDLKDVWLPKSKLKEFGTQTETILISPLVIVSRGHNILNEEGTSAISSIFLLVRPLPNYTDPASIILYCGHYYMNRLKNNNKFCSDTPGNSFFSNYSLVRRDLDDYTRSFVPFSRIPYKEVKLGIVADIIVEIIQLIGRGRRGEHKSQDGVPISLFFIDGAFYKWKHLIKDLIKELQSHPDWNFFYSLYQPIIKSLKEYSQLEEN